MATRVLAFDFGASSGRAMIGLFNGKTVELKEIHRFSNDPVNINGTLYWDVLRLFHEIKQGILAAHHDGGFDSIGIDTWGVDFGLLDREGNLLQNPVHYRDERTVGIMEKVFARIPKEEIYNITGNQFMRFNTLFQLYTLVLKNADLLQRVDKFLLMPDLFNYFLTGEKKAEYTEVSTTQMLDARTGQWCFDLAERLQIPREIFPEIIDSGEVYGNLSASICTELGVRKVPVISVASHDTASAIAATPSLDDDFVYISCGTWSLFGTELKNPVINKKSEMYNITNEGGFGRTTTLLKNIMGLWLVQESRRQWAREGIDLTHGEIDEEASFANGLSCFIDPDAPEFEIPGNMPERVKKFCERTGQHVPASRGEITRCIYESLAFKYRQVFEMIREVTGKSYNAIHIIGGGSQAKVLCQLTANVCQVDVLAGPIEATVTGNVIAQLIALGKISDVHRAREIILHSFEPISYKPVESSAWDSAYERFLSILGK